VEEGELDFGCGCPKAFSTISTHGHLLEFIQKRVGDPSRCTAALIQKWLKAGVIGAMGSGRRRSGDSARGGDLAAFSEHLFCITYWTQWVVWWRKRYAIGDMVMVPLRDDFVIGFEHRKVAERFLGNCRERLREFGLELHPEKTRLIQFGRYAARASTAEWGREAGNL